MAFAYVGNANGTAAAATEIHCNRPAGVAFGNIMILAFAFEGVAAGSGPWVAPNTGSFGGNYIGPANGWQQIIQQDPSGTGTGLEVWAAVHQAGSVNYAMFTGTYSAVVVAAAWSGEYAPNNVIQDGAIRVTAQAQVTGNAPPAPSVFADNGELVVAVGADAMTGSLFGTPSGYTNRVDVARSGAGTAEATLADAVAATTGNTGAITFPNNAASGTTHGATATLAIRPASSTTPSNFDLEASLPPDLDIGDGFNLRVSAHDPVTGAVVSGVSVGTVVFTVDQLQGNPSDLQTGQWFLVPGPNA